MPQKYCALKRRRRCLASPQPCACLATIGQLIDESLDFYGIKSREEARNLVSPARAQSILDERQALDVAQREVRAVRRKR